MIWGGIGKYKGNVMGTWKLEGGTEKGRREVWDCEVACRVGD